MCQGPLSSDRRTLKDLFCGDVLAYRFFAHKPQGFLTKGQPRLRVIFKNHIFCAKRFLPLPLAGCSCSEAFG